MKGRSGKRKNKRSPELTVVTLNDRHGSIRLNCLLLHMLKFFCSAILKLKQIKKKVSVCA
jgi:hypothetical protein